VQRVLPLLANTLLLWIAVSAIALPLGTLLAVVMTKLALPGRRFAWVLTAAMLLMPLYLQTAAWQAGFGTLGGVTSATTGLAQRPLLSGFPGAVWIHAMAAVPWVAVFVSIALRWIPRRYEEQALVHAPPRKVLERITLPLVAPAVAIAALWVFVIVSTEITVTDIFQVRTYAEEIYVQFALTDDPSNLPWGSAPVVFASAALLAAAMLFVSRRIGGDQRSAADHATEPLQFEAGRWKIPAWLCMGTILLLIAGVPLANLVAKVGALTPVEAAAGRGWSVRELFSEMASALWLMRWELAWTFAISASAATIAVVIGIPLAWFGRRVAWRSTPLLMNIALLLCIPGPLVGLAIVEAFQWLDVSVTRWLYDRTIAAPVAAQVVRSLPLVTLLLLAGFRSMPLVQFDLARLDGIGPWRQLLFLALPQRFLAVTATWCFALCIGAGELSASANALVLPPGIDTIARRIFGLLHAGEEDTVWAICLLMFLAFVAAAFLLDQLTKVWLKLSEAQPQPESAGS